MPISHDAQAFTIDGRRTRLVSGALTPSRIPRDEWNDRIHDARMAGLNCIEVVTHWARHEPWPDALNFEGQNDIAEFLRRIQQHGLLAILRAGPFVNNGLDLGGLPAWLLPREDCRLRAADEAWFTHANNYLAELAKHVAPLQRTREPHAPLVAVQVEHEWQCGDDDMAEAALAPFGRALRESGIDVPIINRDNLYHAPVIAGIEGWSDHDTPHAITRQLHFLAPDKPRLLLGVRPGQPDVWGRRTPTTEPRDIFRHLAEALAAGAQVNIDPFFAGTAFGFDAGRLASESDAWLTPDTSPGGALLTHDGRFGEHALAARRICTFATSFHRTFCSIDPDDQPVVAAPHDDASVSVIPSRGRQGSIVWIIAPRKGAPKSIALTLADGDTTEVHLPTDGVAWPLIDVHLFERTTLDLCTLNALALVGRTLIVYGRAGTSGTISINGAPATFDVPRGRSTTIEEHEGVTLVICNEQSVDTTWHHNGTVFVGVSGITPDGEPIPHPQHRTCQRIDQETAPQRIRMAGDKSAGTPRLRTWSVAGTDTWVDGSSDRFVRIDAPGDLPAMGCNQGYAWLRATFRSTATRTLKASALTTGDRVGLYLDGKCIDILGFGPGASGTAVKIPTKRRDHTVTALVDQFGRPCDGNNLNTPDGLRGHLLELEAIKTSAPKSVKAPTLRLLDTRSPLFGVDGHDHTDEHRLTWKFAYRKKADVILEVDPLPTFCVLVINDEAVDVIAPYQRRFMTVAAADLKRGDNVLQLAPLGALDEHGSALKAALRINFVANTLSEKWEWSFAEWEAPADEAFIDIATADMTPRKQAHRKGRPAWWRTSFHASADSPRLALDLASMSKGQIFLNGANFRRYFVATHDGATLDSTDTVHLPPTMLRHDEPNDLLIFDEHGFAPTKVKLTAVK